MILPYDTVENTLRVKTEIVVVDSLDGEGFGVVETSYTWYSQEVGTALANYAVTEVEGQPNSHVFSFLTFDEFTSVMEVELEAELLIYPNPANDFVQVSGLDYGEVYTIFNHQGQMVKTGVLTGDERIYLAELSSGIYVIQVQNGEALIRKKLIVN